MVEPKKYIRELAQQYGLELEKRINNRVEEMKEDDRSHYLVYQVLGITNKEGELIDLYQFGGG